MFSAGTARRDRIQAPDTCSPGTMSWDTCVGRPQVYFRKTTATGDVWFSTVQVTHCDVFSRILEII